MEFDLQVEIELECEDSSQKLNIENKEGRRVKDFIVMIAILILGVVVAGLVLGFKTKLNPVATAGDSAITGIVNQLVP